MSIPAFPLSWPTGWKRTGTGMRTTARFSTTARGGGSQRLTISEKQSYLLAVAIKVKRLKLPRWR